MGKKCIPGIICIENMTLFILLIIVVLFAYLFNMTYNNTNSSTISKDIPTTYPKVVIVSPNNMSSQDQFNNPFNPVSVSIPSDRILVIIFILF